MRHALCSASFNLDEEVKSRFNGWMPACAGMTATIIN
jgi:hypothetical protein